MIPAPFMDRHDTVLQLEAMMIGSVLLWKTNPLTRQAWDFEMGQDQIEDYFTALRKLRE